MLVAIIARRPRALAAQRRLEAARCVIDTRVDRTAVAAGLVPREVVFLFEQDEACAAMTMQQFARGRDADDAPADDAEFVSQIRPRSDVADFDRCDAHKPDIGQDQCDTHIGCSPKSGRPERKAFAVSNAADGSASVRRFA